MNAVRVIKTRFFDRIKGRRERFWVAKLYARQGSDGHAVWQYTGIHSKPRRSKRRALRAGEWLADCYGAVFGGIGPELHDRPVRIYRVIGGLVLDGDEEHPAEGY